MPPLAACWTEREACKNRFKQRRRSRTDSFIVENDVEAMSTAIISVTTTVRRLGLIAQTLRCGLPAVMPLCKTEDRHTPPQDRGAAEFKAIEQLEPEKRKQLELILGRRLIRSRSVAMMRIVPSSSTTAVCARHP